jgi:hypothetical protein
MKERKAMIQVSELAAMALLGSLQSSGVRPDKGLRIKQEGNQFTLHVDTPNENDHITWYNKSPLIIVDPDTEAEIGAGLIDVEEGPEARLVLRHNVPD